MAAIGLDDAELRRIAQAARERTLAEHTADRRARELEDARAGGHVAGDERRLSMWGIIPAAGIGSRIQPLAFSKELLPVGSRLEGGMERPRAVSEHLIERMLAAGVDKLCFVIAPGKSDIINYYGSRIGGALDRLCGAAGAERPVRRAVLRPAADRAGGAGGGRPARHHLVPGSRAGALARRCASASCSSRSSGRNSSMPSSPMPPAGSRPSRSSAAGARSHWVWGAFKLPGAVLHELHALWREPGRGGRVHRHAGQCLAGTRRRGAGVRGGEVYVDVGTLNGYREAVSLLARRPGPRENRAWCPSACCSSARPRPPGPMPPGDLLRWLARREGAAPGPRPDRRGASG